MSIWVKNLETKKEIRRNSLEKRKGLPGGIRQKYSHMITERVLCHPFFQCADMIFCYVAFREEVDTEELIHTALKMGKTVAVPKVHGENQMNFYKIHSLTELMPGYQGIMEPKTENPEQWKINEIKPGLADAGAKTGKRAVMLLPGAAFDKAGNRIGYGGGFYDTYLQKYPCFYKIGLAFSVQCVKEIPAENHDIRVDLIMTELGEF